MTALPIIKPGVYAGINIEDYHSPRLVDGPFATSTMLRRMWAKSPAHAFAEWACNPKREERETTDAMLLGGAAHHMLLGEDNFWKRYVMQPEEYPDDNGLMKKWTYGAGYCKRWRSKQQKAGKIIVKAFMLEAIKGMAYALKAHPLIDGGLLFGEIEQSMVAKHAETGLWIAARPDAIATDGWYSDLKTTTDVTTLAISRTLVDYGYHMQAGLTWLVCEALKLPFEKWSFVFVETKYPFCVRVVELDDSDVARGRQMCEAMLRKMRSCLDADHWPGPGEDVIPTVHLPVREREWIDQRLSTEGK